MTCERNFRDRSSHEYSWSVDLDPKHILWCMCWKAPKAFYVRYKERLRELSLLLPCELVWWMSFTHRSKIIYTALLLGMAHMNRYEMNTYNLFLTNFGRNDLYKLIGYSIIEIVNNALLETSTWKSILMIFSHILDFASFSHARRKTHFWKWGEIILELAW